MPTTISISHRSAACVWMHYKGDAHPTNTSHGGTVCLVLCILNSCTPRPGPMTDGKRWRCSLYRITFGGRVIRRCCCVLQWCTSLDIASISTTFRRKLPMTWHASSETTSTREYYVTVQFMKWHFNWSCSVEKVPVLPTDSQIVLDMITRCKVLKDVFFCSWRLLHVTMVLGPFLVAYQNLTGRGCLFFAPGQSAFGIPVTWLPCLHTKHLPTTPC